jgi:hypothetical protein
MFWTEIRQHVLPVVMNWPYFPLVQITEKPWQTEEAVYEYFVANSLDF